jgi:hypothetical protein
MASGIETVPPIVIRADLPMYKGLWRRAHRTCLMAIDNNSINFQLYDDEKKCNGEIFNLNLGDITSINKLESSITIEYNTGITRNYIEITNCEPGKKSSGCTIDLDGFKIWLDNLLRKRREDIARFDKERLLRRELVRPKETASVSGPLLTTGVPYSTPVYVNPKTGAELLSTLRAKQALEDRAKLDEIGKKSVVDDLSERLSKLRGGIRRRRSSKKTRKTKRRSSRRRV